MSVSASCFLSPLAVLIVTGCAGPATIDETRLIDLTHSFNADTVYWPTARRFELNPVAHGHDAAGRWYASNEFCASEHGGTHLDAPIHFADQGRTANQVPIDQLIGSARVIDVRAQCERDRDYLLRPEDITAYETRHGRINRGDIVLMHTGFGRHYPDLKRYLGSAVRGTADNLHFPGFGADAARLLVQRGVDCVGLDTASLDHGPSKDFAAHRVFAEANVPGLENVANLDKLPARGATLIALPMKIEGGTGGPCRIVALLPSAR